MWECHLINGTNNGHSLLVYRLHHALTDGQGSIRALLSVTSADEDLTKLQYSAGYGCSQCARVCAYCAVAA